MDNEEITKRVYSSSEFKSYGFIQKFWEFIIPSIAFACCFSLDSQVELKVLLMIIVIKLCYGFGENWALEKEIRKTKLSTLIEIEKLKGTIIALNSNELENDDIQNKIELINQVEESFDNNFYKSFDEQRKLSEVLGGNQSLSGFLIVLSNILALAFPVAIGYVLYLVLR